MNRLMLRTACACIAVLVFAALSAGSAGAALPAFIKVGHSLPTGTDPRGVAISPDGKLLVVANGDDNNLSLYSIAGNGALTAVGTPIATGTHPVAVAFDPNPQAPFLAVADQTGHQISMYAVASGSLTPVGSFDTGNNTAPSSLAFSPGGNLLAVADTGSVHGIGIFQLGFGGQLMQVPNSPFRTTDPVPISVAWSPGGSMIAAANFTSANTVSVYAVTDVGQITGEVAGSPLTVGHQPIDAQFSRDGSFLAVSNEIDGTISVRRTSDFLPVPGSPFATGSTTVGAIAYSPGSNLLAASNANGTVAMFSYGADGALSEVPGSPLTPSGPTSASLAFGRSGGLLAVANVDPDNTVSMYSVPHPAARIASPAANGIYARNQSVPTRFACADAPFAPGLTSCADSNGATTSPGHLDTTAVGHHTYTVTATSRDGQTGSASIAYTVAGAPKIQLVTPANGFDYQKTPKALYRCKDGAFGPGIASCKGTVRNGRPVPHRPLNPFKLQTSETFTVTAISKDGQKTVETVHYWVGVPLTLTLNVTPSQAGTKSHPEPVLAEVKWTFLVPSGESRYELDLPSDFLTNPHAFTVCGARASQRRVLPKSCDGAIVAAGELSSISGGSGNPGKLGGGTHPVHVGCDYQLTLLHATGRHLVLRLDPGAQAPRSSGCKVMTTPVTVVTHRAKDNIPIANLTFSLPSSVGVVRGGTLRFGPNGGHFYLSTIGCPALPHHVNAWQARLVVGKGGGLLFHGSQSGATGYATATCTTAPVKGPHPRKRRGSGHKSTKTPFQITLNYPAKKWTISASTLQFGDGKTWSDCGSKTCHLAGQTTYKEFRVTAPVRKHKLRAMRPPGGTAATGTITLANGSKTLKFKVTSVSESGWQPSQNRTVTVTFDFATIRLEA
jgi:6-phosphogluconolactonase (cycloisomerase 2 family)